MSFRTKERIKLVFLVVILVLFIGLYPDYYREKQKSIENNLRIIEAVEKQTQREEDQKRKLEAREAQKAKEDMEFLKEIRKKRENGESVVRSRHVQVV